MKSTRRQFLKTTGAAGLAAGALSLPGVVTAQSGPTGTNGKPKRIIFLVSDGMSMGALSMADLFSRQVRGRGTHFYELLENKKASRGFFLTHSLNCLVTDSAAAASAWGSGSRVFNDAVNVLPDGRKLAPILQVLKDAGYGTGLVTTTLAPHATPAGFGATNVSRRNYDEIAEDYIDRVDVIMGGGRNYYTADRRSDGRDLIAAHTAKGYEYWSHRDQCIAPGEKPDRILGLYNTVDLPYTVDQRQSPELMANIPTLAEMTKAALASLEKHPKGFLVQVEGARVDHAAHTNDAAGTLWDQIAFDDAIGICLEFQRRNPETLIVVTSDHGNSNPGLNGMGPGYLEADESFARIAKAKSSVADFRNFLNRGDSSPSTMKEQISERFGLDIEDRFAEKLSAAFAGEDVGEIAVLQRLFSGILAQVIGNHTGVGWTGHNHTEDPTVIAALGPNQEQWAGIIKNTQAFTNMTRHFGINFKNPAMTREEAMELAHLAPTYQHEDDDVFA